MNPFKTLCLAAILLLAGCNQPEYRAEMLKDLHGQNPALAGLYPGIDCSGDVFEPNDTKDSAQWISPGEVGELELCGNDDWYFLQVTRGDVVEVTAEFLHRDGDLDIELFGEDSTNRVMANSSDDNETAVLEAQKTGRLYLRVFGYAGAENHYALKFSVTESENWPGSCPTDGLEPNDREAPRELQPGSYQNLTVCNNQSDYYSVYMNRGDTLQATVKNLSSSDSIRFALYGANNGTGYSVDLWDREETMNLVAQESGLAVIKLSVDHSFWRADPCDYQMTVAVFKPDHQECLDDPMEPNDSQEQARSILEDSWIALRSCPDNPDLFLQILRPAERLEVLMQHDAGAEDLSLAVLHPNGEQSLAARTDEVQGRINTTAGVCGPRYLQVTNHSGQDIPYTLRVAVRSPSGSSQRLDPLCGDQRSGFGCGSTTWAGPNLQGVGSRAYKILLKECSSCPASLRISARLIKPVGVDYELHLEDEHGSEKYGRVREDGQNEYLTWRTDGQDTELVLRVRYKGYDDSPACLNDWVLDIRGGGTEANFSGFLP